jgi:capsular exopolysaccharide synthesis family protein
MSKNYELLRQVQQASTAVDTSRLQHAAANSMLAKSRALPAYAVSNESDLLRAVKVVKKHWLMVLLFTFFVAGTVTVVTLLTRPVYDPVASVEVNPPGTELFSMQDKNVVEAGADYFETYAKKLQSDQLAVDVIRGLLLAQMTEFAGNLAGTSAAADTSSGPLRLTPAENRALQTFTNFRRITRDPASRLIYVSVGSHDPKLAAVVTNAVVQRFIEREYINRDRAIAQSSQWLQRQLDDIRLRMRESNRTLADFEKVSGITAIGENANTFSEQVLEMNRQLTQAQADRIQLQAYLNRLSDQPTTSLPQISGNPVVQQLTLKLAEVRAELSQALAIYGTNHPSAKKLQNQADELQAQLNAQQKAIRSDLHSSYAAAKAREELIESQVKGASTQMMMLSQYNALKKEADTNTQLYNTLFQKIKEAGIVAESKSSNIRAVDQARELERPTRPNRLFNIAAGLLAGIFGGIMLAFIFEAFDNTIRTMDDVMKCVGTAAVSLMPVIPRVTKQLPGPVFVLDRPNSAEAEALRNLYVSVRLSRFDATQQVILVTSPHQGEGKTTLSVNLADALAERGRTCIVDTDLRTNGVASAFGIENKYGLSEVLLGTLALDEVLVPSARVPNLTLLPAGLKCADAARFISSSTMAEVIRKLRGEFDFVVIDSPPVVPFASGPALAALVDGVVLVGRAGTTKREALVRAIERLNEVHSAPLLQIVLNAAEYPTVDYGVTSKRKGTTAQT